MSVQAGIWNFDGREVDLKLLSNFSEALRPQGPDDELSFLRGSIAMLYRPFYTTAESRREKQPKLSSKGFVITWDGRLDNREELIADLRGNLNCNPTDLDIVAAAFDRHQTDCFRRIIGDWAVSIWKPQEQELVFAVDYLAIRHIFYYLKRDRLWWSTDLGPLVLLSGDKFQIDDDYVSGYFANDPDAHVTPFQEIREVPPGQFVRIRNGSVSVERYWRFTPKSRIRYKTDAEYEQHFRHLFRQAVRRRLRSDSPVLAELSGGLDSSSIVCMADDILATEGAQTARLETLSYFDRTEPNGDDWVFFPKVEDRRGKIGYHIDVSKCSESASLEYPEFSFMPGYLGAGRQVEADRARVVRDSNCRVVLSGMGGDEFTGGIPDPSAQLADLIVQFRLFALAERLLAWSLVKRKPWLHLLWQASVLLLPTSMRRLLVRQARVEQWIESRFSRRTNLPKRQLDVPEYFGLLLPTRRSYIAGLMLTANKMAKLRPPSLAHEERRYPFLDQDLIKFVLSIPADQLLRPGERRSLMRRALFGIVPAEILSRRTKQFGARTPIKGLDSNWEALRATFELPLSADLGYINRSRFIEALRAARSGKRVHTVRLLRTISLEFWLRGLAKRGLIDKPTLRVSRTALLEARA